MKRLRAAWARWVALTSRREDASSLAVARIIAGATVSLHLLLLRGTGAVEQAWVDVKFGGGHATFSEWWLAAIGGATPRNVDGVLLVTAIAAALMAYGFATRASIFVTWLGLRTLSDSNWGAGGSSDDLLLNGLFILFWSGSGRALSIDQWLRRRKDPLATSEAPAWPRYVLIFQIITVYWTTGIQKLSTSWFPPPIGTLDAIWYILQQVTWNRWAIDPVALAPWFRVTQLATAGAWFFELGGLVLALAYWYRYTRDRPGRVRAFFNAPLARLERWLGPRVKKIDFRLLYLAFGFCMHFGIFVLLEVGPFFNAVLVLYAGCITPEEWKALFAKLRITRREEEKGDRLLFGTQRKCGRKPVPEK